MTDLDRILRDLADRGSAAAGASAPSEIRKAGDHRRRRRHAIVFATVALVIFVGSAAAGAAVYGLPGGTQHIPVSPAGSASSVARPTQQAEVVHELADDPFVNGPFSWPGSYQGLKPTGSEGDFRGFCLPSLDDLGAAQVRTAEYSELEASVISGALEFETVRAAEEAAAEIRSLPQSCSGSDQTRDTTVHEPRDRNAGDEAYVFAQTSQPNAKNAGSETSYFGYGVVRDGNILVLIEFGAFGPPVENAPYATWSDTRLNELINRAVG